jgi:ABC-type uncharacterized transport system substrate-binding protein
VVRLKVDVIFAPGTAETEATQNATRTIPIIMATVGDPVGRGAIASLAQPGGNVTGLSYSVGYEIFGKQLELLKEVVPKVSRVAILGNPRNPHYGPALREAQVARRSLGVQLQVLEARDPNEFDRAFTAMVKQRAEALLVLADPMSLQHRTPLAQLAGKNRLPAIYGFRGYVDAGGLLSYGPNLSDLFRRAATYVDKILKGAKLADLPVEQSCRSLYQAKITERGARGAAEFRGTATKSLQNFGDDSWGISWHGHEIWSVGLARICARYWPDSTLLGPFIGGRIHVEQRLCFHCERSCRSVKGVLNTAGLFLLATKR